MIQSIENISLTGVNAQNLSVNVEELSAMAYRIQTDTASQITGNKTIAFTGTPVEGLTVLNFIIEGGINTAGASKLIIGGVTVPDLFAAKKSIIFFEYVNSAWTVHYSMSAEQTGSIDGSALVDGSVPAVKLENDIAGDGMDRDGNGGVIPKLEAVQPSLQVSATELGVKLDPTRAVTKDSNGVGVNLEASNPTLEVATNELGVKFPADGGLEATADGLEVKIDPDGGLEKTTAGIASKCVCMKEVMVGISSAQILTLNSNPVQLIPAPGAGLIIEVVSAAVRVFGGAPYATNTNLQLKSGIGPSWQCDCLASSLERRYSFDQIPLVSELFNQLGVNTALTIAVENADPTAGNFAIEVYVLYRIIEQMTP